MAKRQRKRNPIIEYLWDGDLSKMEKVLGKEMAQKAKEERDPDVIDVKAEEVKHGEEGKQKATSSRSSSEKDSGSAHEGDKSKAREGKSRKAEQGSKHESEQPAQRGLEQLQEVEKDVLNVMVNLTEQVRQAIPKGFEFADEVSQSYWQSWKFQRHLSRRASNYEEFRKSQEEVNEALRVANTTIDELATFLTKMGMTQNLVTVRRLDLEVQEVEAETKKAEAEAAKARYEFEKAEWQKKTEDLKKATEPEEEKSVKDIAEEVVAEVAVKVGVERKKDEDAIEREFHIKGRIREEREKRKKQGWSEQAIEELIEDIKRGLVEKGLMSDQSKEI